jgi:3-dehydroquinate synthase/shikimate kinase/3-dehydroquinate synthase
VKSPYIEKSIKISCIIKKKIIEADEKEKSYRKILNFGHTFGHAFEATNKFSKNLNHGQAVLLGISCANKFAMYNKILNKKDYKIINNHLIKNSLPNNINKYFSVKNIKKILFYMTMDKKNKNKKINLVLSKKIGKVTYTNFYKPEVLEKFFKRILIN